MSCRWWLGSDERQWAEYNLCDFASIDSMAKVTAFSGHPAKAYAPDRETMDRFIAAMEKQGFEQEQFSDLQIGDEDNWTPYKQGDSSSLKDDPRYCQHPHLNEDGICRSCGADKRGIGE